MAQERESLQPVEGANRALRQRLNLKGELALATLPTLTVLVVFFLVDVISTQRLLFASLASSAFLIYLDPQHGTNTTRTLVIGHMLAALLGWGAYLLLGPGYLSGGLAMMTTIFVTILIDAVHPPAISTSLIFAFRAGTASNLLLFGLAVSVTAILVVLEQLVLRLLNRFSATTL